MPRTIVRVQENFEGPDRFFLEAPKTVPGGRVGYTLASQPGATPFAELRNGAPLAEGVRVAGASLYTALSQHPAVLQAFATALTQMQGGESPICILLESANADLLPWESLYENVNGFLALDSRWPIARLKEAQVDVIAEFTLVPPLRILAVLSAAGSDDTLRAPGMPEWEALWTALMANQAANGIPVRLQVLVGEDDLKSHIDAIVRPPRLEVAVELISDKDKVLDTILSFRPQLLHFFCHGNTKGTPHLSIGTRGDWEGLGDGSVAITANELRQQGDKGQAVWLVTLNCCESAAQSKDARNLASSLVTAGFPAALGMREMVDTQNAHLLTRSFYRTTLQLISAVPENAAARTFEWPCTLLAARNRLATDNGPKGVPLPEAAREAKQWTIPVMYTRVEPFLLKRVVANPAIDKLQLARTAQEIQKKYNEVATMELPAGLKEGILADFQKELKQIEAQIRG
jgi:CHAT domain-containing protein